MAKVDPHNCWNYGDEELDSMLGSILDFPDFPMESLEEEDGLPSDWDATKSHYLGLGPIPMDVLMGLPTIADTKLDVGHTHTPVCVMDTKPEIKHKNYQLEDTAVTFQSQSPVSVLESNSSSLVEDNLHLHPRIAKRTRSKRRPPSGVNPWRRCPTEDSLGMPKYTPPASDYSEPANATPLRPTKKCTHCEITKTPQWREGPLGPKTLCNACGVRYRSGRLFPEYRPAASPTFVPSLHSNSHKKVIEMRNKGKHQVNKVEQPQPEFIPASNYLYDPIC